MIARGGVLNDQAILPPLIPGRIVPVTWIEDVEIPEKLLSTKRVVGWGFCEAVGNGGRTRIIGPGLSKDLLWRKGGAQEFQRVWRYSGPLCDLNEATRFGGIYSLGADNLAFYDGDSGPYNHVMSILGRTSLSRNRDDYVPMAVDVTVVD